MVLPLGLTVVCTLDRIHGPGVLALHPGSGQAYHASMQQTTTQALVSAPSFDTTSLMNALHAASTQQQYPSHGDWLMDTGASSHMTGDQGNLPKFSSPLLHNSSHVIVGNGSALPILGSGSTHLHAPHPKFLLHNVLYTPKLVQNLVSIRKITRDNVCSIEFDLDGFSVKDLCTKIEFMRSNSNGELYPFYGSNQTKSSTALLASTVGVDV